MKMFKYRGRVITAATKAQAVRKVLASGRRSVKASAEDAEEQVREALEGLMDDTSLTDLHNFESLCGKVLEQAEGDSALQAAIDELGNDKVRRLANDVWFYDYDRALGAWERSLPAGYKAVQVPEWAGPGLVNGDWWDHVAYCGIDGVEDFKELDELMAREGVCGSDSLPFEYESDIDGADPFNETNADITMPMAVGTWEPLMVRFEQDLLDEGYLPADKNGTLLKVGDKVKYDNADNEDAVFEIEAIEPSGSNGYRISIYSDDYEESHSYADGSDMEKV